MAMKLPGNVGVSSLLKDGYKHLQGLEEAVYRNIEAAEQLSQVTRTSFGPNGMNKMVINHLEKLFVTNDAATIIRELEVVHPAAKILVMAAQQQEFEVGDASNFVVVFAGELLRKADRLLRLGVHTADVVEGYEVAIKFILGKLAGLALPLSIDLSKEEDIVKAVRTSISSKQYGYEGLVAGLVAKAAIEVMPSNRKNFNVDSVRVVKVLGSSLLESEVVRGMVFHREPEGDIKKALKAKIAIFSCALDIAQTETKGTVLLQNANDLLSFSKGEEDRMNGIIKQIADSGVNVIVTGSGIGDMALHFCNRYKIMVVKILSKFELRRLCRVTGATIMTRLGPPLPEEMGMCDVVQGLEIGSNRTTVFRQTDEKTRTSTIVLRGATTNFLDDVERAIDDGVNTVKALARDSRLVAGAGASEIELGRILLEEASKTASMHSHAMKAFAEAFEVVPRTLAENAGMDGTEVVSELYAAHAAGRSNTGVNIEDPHTRVVDVVTEVEYPIMDSLACKEFALKLAADAALTVLRVDQIIMSKPAGGPKVPKGGNSMDSED